MKKEWVVRSRLKHLITERELLENRRIYQTEIAEKTGLREATISRWMSPKPFTRIEVPTAMALCIFLECKFEELMYTDYLPAELTSA